MEKGNNRELIHMSAINWLPFISPFIWILLILNGLAFWPLPKKNQKARRVKFTIVLFAIVLIGWVLAVAAIHIMTPIVRVNTLALSKLLLVPSLFLLGGLLIMRLHQGKNFLTTLLKYIGRLIAPVLKGIAETLALIAPHLLTFFADVVSNYADTHEKRRHREERDKIEKSHMNWRGDYAGEDDINKY